jgi:hypothetical protein
MNPILSSTYPPLYSNFIQANLEPGVSIMSVCMPPRPKFAAEVPSYAADSDKAERASSEIERSTIQIPLKTNTFIATSVEKESLSRSSTAGRF